MRFARRRQGFTFIEILIVMLLVTTLSTMGVGVFTGVLEYFRCRRTMENLMWDLRKCQQRARSRGHAAGATVVGVSSPANFGVAFYQGRLLGTGAIDATGFSYYVYGPTFVVPPATLAGLVGSGPNFRRENLHEFDAALLPVRDASVSLAPVVVPPADSPAANKRIQFTADVGNENGDMVPDGLSGLTAIQSMDFVLQTGDGYFRITFDNNRYIGLRYVEL